MNAEDMRLRAAQAEEMARKLFAFASDLKAASQSELMLIQPEPPGSRELRNRINNMLEFRRMRSRMIEASIFGEPAWDMLLLLYDAHLAGAEITEEGLSDSAGLSRQVANRWITVLTEFGLAERRAGADAETDAPVMLTQAGLEKMLPIVSEAYPFLQG